MRCIVFSRGLVNLLCSRRKVSQARGLALLLAALTTILALAALNPVAALAIPSPRTQDRAGTFNPANRIFVGGRRVESLCSRRDPNTPDSGFDGGIVDLADGAPAVHGLYAYDVVVAPTTRLTTSLIATPLADGSTWASAERSVCMDDQILGDEDAAALDAGEDAATDAAEEALPRSLPYRGEPNSTAVLDRGNGSGQIRDYGPDGIPTKP